MKQSSDKKNTFLKFSTYQHHHLSRILYMILHKSCRFVKNIENSVFIFSHHVENYS